MSQYSPENQEEADYWTQQEPEPEPDPMPPQHTSEEKCDFCKQMRDEAKRYYPRTFRWFCPNSNETYVIEHSETTNAVKKQRNDVLDKMADGTFGKEVQSGFIEGTKNLIV